MMINQTELHRMRIDAGGMTATAHVRVTLGAIRPDFTNLKYALGNIFLQQYAHPDHIAILENSDAFKAWWSNAFYINNWKLFHEKLTSEKFFNTHTQHFDNERLVDSFNRQYDAFLVDGLTSKQGGVI